jgi:hypothetical protein
MNGLRSRCSHSNCSYSSVEVPETIAVLSECDPGIELGWEAGIRFAHFKKPQ